MIPGGYILKARKALHSDLMDKPPLWSKLWDWMLLRAEWREGAKLERGQFRTSIEEMQTAMSWLVGYRRVTPSVKEIRSAYEWFAGRSHEGRNEGHPKGTMIGIAKGTRGMLITILNYNEYQNPKNYEGHDEGHNENPVKGTQRAQEREEVLKTFKNEFKSTPESFQDPLADKQPKPAKQPKPKRTYMDHRPTACTPAKWKQLFAYSWRFHKNRAKTLGARAPFTVKKVLDGAKTLDNMTRVRGISSGQIIAAMDWVVGDSFWNEQVRALSSLTNISRNGDTKYANILTAMAKDLVP